MKKFLKFVDFHSDIIFICISIVVILFSNIFFLYSCYKEKYDKIDNLLNKNLVIYDKCYKLEGKFYCIVDN